MIDEGYTKYHVDWQRSPPLPAERVAELNDCRRRLWRVGLVGHDEEHDVGYGNVSARDPDLGGFVISGTQTGEIATTGARHYSLVTEYSIEHNRVRCRGPVQASSETLTHAAIYELDPGIGAVIHVHSSELWHSFIDELPTTDRSVPYGTPAMAREFQRLFHETDFGRNGIAVMGGHEDGLIAYGHDPAQGTRRILQLMG